MQGLTPIFNTARNSFKQPLHVQYVKLFINLIH